MSLRVDTSRAPRTYRELHNLLHAVEQANAEDESEWIEWKSRLDLSAKSARVTLARHIIGMANRRVGEAARFAEGFGYILVGIEPGNRCGVNPVDFADLRAGIASYLGSYGPRWTASYDNEEGLSVLIITVDPPRYGDPVHTLHRDFERYRAGDIFVRKLGSTEKADPEDVEVLTQRKARQEFPEVPRSPQVALLIRRPSSIVVIATTLVVTIVAVLIYRLTSTDNHLGGNPITNIPPDACSVSANSSATSHPAAVSASGLLKATYITSLTNPKYVPSVISFSPNGNLLADGSPDYNNLGVSKGTVYLWNISTRESISVPDPDNGPVWAVAYAPDGKTIATSDADSAIWLMSTETCKYTSLTSSGSGAPGPLTYAPDGKTLAAGDTASTAIYLWNTTTREPVKLSGPPSGSGIYFDDKVTSVAYAPDGKMLAAAYNDGAIWLWNTDTRKYRPLPVPNSHWFDTIAYAPDGGTLAAGSFQGATYMWDTATRKVMHLLRGPSDIYSVNSVAYMPGGRILAIGYSNGAIWLWDTVSGKIDAKLDPPSGSEGLTSITFNPTGTILAVGDRSGSIYLWRISYEASGTQPAASGSATIRPSSAQP